MPGGGTHDHPQDAADPMIPTSKMLLGFCPLLDLLPVQVLLLNKINTNYKTRDAVVCVSSQSGAYLATILPLLQVIDELLTYDMPANGSYLHKWRINENEYQYKFYSSNGYGIDANRTFWVSISRLNKAFWKLEHVCLRAELMGAIKM